MKLLLNSRLLLPIAIVLCGVRKVRKHFATHLLVASISSAQCYLMGSQRRT